MDSRVRELSLKLISFHKLFPSLIPNHFIPFLRFKMTSKARFTIRGFLRVPPRSKYKFLLSKAQAHCRVKKKKEKLLIQIFFFIFILRLDRKIK